MTSAAAPARFLPVALALLACIPSRAEAQTAIPDLDCLIDASARVKVSAPMAGLIKRIAVDRGDVVKAGDVLVEMDDAAEAAQFEVAQARAQNDQQVAAARAKRDNARRTAERMQRLKSVNAGALSDADLDEAVMEARVADATLRDAEMALETAKLEASKARVMVEQKRVMSPISGVVVEKLMSPGEYRHEQAHFVTLARLDPLHVEVFVPVSHYGRITAGTQATVQPEQPVGGRHLARVTVVDRIFDAASGTFGVRLALPNPDLSLPAGLRCKVSFDALPG